jgi:hypothetical protein
MSHKFDHELVDYLIHSYEQDLKKRADMMAEHWHQVEVETVRALARLVGDRIADQLAPGDVYRNLVNFGPVQLQYVKGEGGFYFWQVWGRCPRCGEGCWSAWVSENAARVGEQLVEFRPDSMHKCQPPPLPYRERFRLALRILREGR